MHSPTSDLQRKVIRLNQLVTLPSLAEIEAAMKSTKIYQGWIDIEGMHVKPDRNAKLDLVLARIQLDKPARQQKRREDLKAGKEIVERRAVGMITMKEGDILCGTRCYHFPDRRTKQKKVQQMTWEELQEHPHDENRVVYPCHDPETKEPLDLVEVHWTETVVESIRCDCEGLRDGSGNFISKLPTLSKRAKAAGALIDTYHYDRQLELVEASPGGVIQSWGDVNVLLAVVD
jgi:hypothetical protein